jgi:hypothetical protein
MRPFFALLAKEARQHALVSLALFVTVGLGYLITLLGSIANDGVTMLDAHAAFERVFLPIVAIFLGHRLVVAEYSVKTQLFLEGLPIPRVLFVSVKALVFAGVLFVASGGSLLSVSLLASLRESIGLAYFAIVAARTLAWTLFLFAFFFSMGFVGRYRYPIFVFLGLGLLALDQIADVDATDCGPIALVGPTFVLERSSPPWIDLATTTAASLALLGLAFGLALAKSGTIAENLARRLSARERSIVGGAVIAALISLSAFEEEPEEFEPVTEGPGWLADRSEVRVFYGRAELEAGARRVRDLVRGDVQALDRAIDLRLPRVAIVFDESLPAGVIDTPPGRHAVVRVHPSAADDPLAVRAGAVRALLVAATEGRADFEPYAWILDGFPGWLVARDHPRTAVLARARYAFGAGGLDRDRVRAWHRTREELGPPIATALAESGIDTLARDRGPDAALALANATFGRPVRTSSLTVLDELVDPPDARFEDATSLGFDAFLERWRARLAESRETTAVEARVEVAREEGAIRTIRAHAPPSATLVHHRLGRFDEPLDEWSLARARGPVTGVYAPGDRVFVAVEVPSEALGCSLRLAAQRIEIE